MPRNTDRLILAAMSTKSEWTSLGGLQIDSNRSKSFISMTTVTVLGPTVLVSWPSGCRQRCLGRIRKWLRSRLESLRANLSGRARASPWLQQFCDVGMRVSDSVPRAGATDNKKGNILRADSHLWLMYLHTLRGSQ